MGDISERLNRLYASAVYDCLRALGHDNCVLPPGICALDPSWHLAGEVYTINGHYEVGQDPDTTLRAWAKLLSDAPSGKVLLCQPNTDEVALMGGLSAVSLQTKGVLGYIVDGASRDIGDILAQNFPTFCRFATPKDIVGRWVAESVGEDIAIGGVAISSGDYVIADRDGVVIIPRAIAEQVVSATEAKAATEGEMETAIKAGMDPLAAYDKFGVF